MEHWFDDLTRKLVKQPLSRRGMVSWTARIGVAVAGTGLIGREATAVSAADIATAPSALGLRQAAAGAQAPGALGLRQTAAGTCTVNDSYGVLRTDFSISSAGSIPLTLSHTIAAEVATGNTFSAFTVKSGNEVVRKMSTMAVANGAGAASTSHGARYTGTKRASFRTDGTTLEGQVDDRATEPAPLASDTSVLRFKDGKPERPSLQAAADLEQAVNALLLLAQSQPVTCRPDGKASKEITACTDSQLGCRSEWLKCSLAAAHASLACGPLASACYLKTVNATCDRAVQQCYRTAKSSGACCPAYCKGEATCCQTSWGCCPPNDKARINGQSPSKAWPTCPRCGPLTAAITPWAGPRPPRKPGPDAAPKPLPSGSQSGR